MLWSLLGGGNRGRSCGLHSWSLELHAKIDLPRALGAIVECIPLVHDAATKKHAHRQATLADQGAGREILVLDLDYELVQLWVYDREDKDFIPHGCLVSVVVHSCLEALATKL